MKCQLIVHEDNDVVEHSRKAVEAALAAVGDKAFVIQEHDFERAHNTIRCQDDATWSLVVVGTSTPESSFTKGCNADFGPAHRFIRDLKASHPSLPVIALTTTKDPELAGLLSVYQDTAALVEFNADWRETLTTRASELSQAVRSDEPALELAITLKGDRGSWRMERIGRIGCIDSGELYIDKELFDELSMNSQDLRDLANGDSFLRRLDLMGVKLRRFLFDGSRENQELWAKFVDLRARVGGTENVRVFFTMPLETQDVVVEALKERDGPKAFWMLQAPIVRQYTCAGNTPTLFKDDQSRRGLINCLVIDADPAPGNIDGGEWNGHLDALTENRNEATEIVRILNEAGSACGIGRVRRVSLDRTKHALIPTLREALSDGPWQLVHFAGHAVLSQGQKAGLVLAASPGEVLSFDGLAAMLSQTQFLFVSSCRSANTAFLSQIIQNIVPALLGYRWPVSDFGAARFAASFYNALFKRGQGFKSLEYAFLRARQEAFDRAFDGGGHEVTWASPLLLTQLPYRLH